MLIGAYNANIMPDSRFFFSTTTIYAAAFYGAWLQHLWELFYTIKVAHESCRVRVVAKIEVLGHEETAPGGTEPRKLLCVYGCSTALLFESLLRFQRAFKYVNE